MSVDKKLIANLTDIEKDIIRHPEDDLDYLEPLFSSDVLTQAEISLIRGVFSKIIGEETLSANQKNYLLANSWKVNFFKKPPTVNELLSEKYIGDTANVIYPHVEGILKSFFDVTSPIRHIVLYTAIGVGKSFIAVLINLFIAIHVSLMRNAKKYLGVSSATVLCNVLLSFTKEKALELLVEPFRNIISTSDMFIQCRTVDQMERRQKEAGYHKLCWTTAKPASVLSVGAMEFKHLSQITSILGLSILVGSCSELTFFKERGWSEDKIMQFYTDLRGRVDSRFIKKTYYARTILDSSPNTIESKIDNWILKKAPLDKSTLIVKGSKWKFQPGNFPVYFKDRSQVFPVFTGTASKSPKILNEHEISNYDKSEIINVPIDAKNTFKLDINKALKDWAGLPSGAEDKLISNLETVENVFIEHIPNIYTFIHAPANLMGEKLIWEQIKDQFFSKIGSEYQINLHPKAERFISADQSLIGDITGIAMSHAVRNLAGEIVYITDFSIPIVPTKERINLDAIKFFIHDLRRYGGLNLNHVSFDKFESENAKQYLKRNSFDVHNLSVDTSTAPYLNYVSLLQQNRVKAGRNIFLKNNFKSLIMSSTPGGKPKVDHIIGDVDNMSSDSEWNTSMLGYFAKDVSDAVVASVELAVRHGSGNPYYIFDESSNETNEEIMIRQLSQRLYLKPKKIT